MLWESVDAEAALTRRFGFTTVDAAVRWLDETLSSRYKIELGTVDRLVISAGNLMAWTVTSEGPLIVKCCVSPGEHPRLQAIAELLAWLRQEDFPVSAPVPTPDGELQIEAGALSVGVQRVVAGDMLDAGNPDHAARAGTVLARLHELFLRYPRAGDLDRNPTPVALEADIAEWLHKDAPGDPRLQSAVAALRQGAAGLDSSGMGRQLLHLDYRSANILWAGGDIVAVLDFEQIATGYRVADVAQAATLLGTLYHNWGPLSPESLAAFLAAYEQRLPFSGKERAWLSVLTLRKMIGWSANGGPMYERWLALVAHLAAEVH